MLPRITGVYVEWSESQEFKEGKTYSFTDFESRAHRAAKEAGYNSGYFKTKIEVSWEDKSAYKTRLDLSMDCDQGFYEHTKEILLNNPKTDFGKRLKQFFQERLIEGIPA